MSVLSVNFTRVTPAPRLLKSRDQSLLPSSLNGGRWRRCVRGFESFEERDGTEHLRGSEDRGVNK